MFGNPFKDRLNNFASLVFRSERIVPTKKLLHHAVKNGKNEEHIERLVAYLMLAVEICTDKASGTYEKLQEGVRQRTGIQAPHIEDAFAHPTPCDAAIFGILTAYRAVVSPEHVTAVGTTVLLLFLVGIVIGFVLPSAETSECFFQVHALENKTEQNPNPVRSNAGDNAADSMGTDGFAYKLAVAEGVKHSGMGGEVAAPAHAHSCEDGNGVVGDNAFGDETGNKTKGSTDGTQSGDGEGNEGTALETKEPVEDEVDFVCQPGDDRYTLVGGTGVGVCGGVGTEGEHHDNGGDAKHAGDDGEANAYTVFATVEQRIEEALEDRALTLEGDLLLVAGGLGHGSIQFGVGFEGEALHETCGDDAADDSTEDAHQSAFAVAETRHKGEHHKTHTKSCTEVSEGHQLVFLEVLGEVLVLSEGDDYRVVGEEGENGTQCGHPREVVEGFHERTQDVLEQSHHTEFNEQFSYCPHEHTDGHDVEDRFEQQVIGCLHEGVEHVRERHAIGKKPEESYEENEKNEGFDRALAGELERVFEQFTEQFFCPTGVFGRHFADGLM